MTAYDYTPWLKHPTSESNTLPPCTWGSVLIEWMNKDETRSALHIPSEIQAWDLCVGPPTWNYVRGTKGSQWVYEALKGKYRMLHFSGDTDGAVPTIGTEHWIADMNWPVEKDWAQYNTTVNGTEGLGGYYESYVGNFTFGTVHGAGHMAPQFKPEATYSLVFNWIFGRPL